jgi:putative lipoprotein
VRTPALAAVALITGCAGRSNLPAPAPIVTGHVTYRERVALPADAEVHVALLDASRQDAAATPVADTTIRPGGHEVPLPFALRYDPKRIDPRRDYAIRATITSGGQLAFTTTAVVKVITRDHPTMVDLILTPVRSP